MNTYHQYTTEELWLIIVQKALAAGISSNPLHIVNCFKFADDIVELCEEKFQDPGLGNIWIRSIFSSLSQKISTEHYHHINCYKIADGVVEEYMKRFQPKE